MHTAIWRRVCSRQPIFILFCAYAILGWPYFACSKLRWLLQAYNHWLVCCWKLLINIISLYHYYNMLLFYQCNWTNIGSVSILYVFKNSCVIEFNNYKTRMQLSKTKKNGRLTFCVVILIWSKVRSNCKRYRSSKKKRTVRY